MIVGILRVDLAIPGSDTLKDKRQVIKSVLDIARNRFGVSAAEVDYLDAHRKSGLGFACVSNDKLVVERMLRKLLDHIESNPLCEVVESDLDFV